MDTKQTAVADDPCTPEQARPRYQFYKHGIREPCSVAAAISAVLMGRPIRDLALLLALTLLAWIAVEVVRGREGLSALGFVLVTAIVIVVSAFGAAMLLARDETDAQNCKNPFHTPPEP